MDAIHSESIRHLRVEQIERIKSRDLMINFTIVSIGIITSAMFSGSRPLNELLLAIPWVTLAFGWSFILNDIKIARLASYFRYVEREADGWEAWRERQGPSWIERPLVGGAVQLLLFVLPGVVGISAYVVLVASAASKLSVILFTAFAALLLLALAFAIVTAAQVRMHPHKITREA